MEKLLNNVHWLLRLPLIGTFIAHGYPILGSNIDMGFIGYLVGPFEFFGALLVLIGAFTTSLITRIGSAMISIIMIGAIYLHLFKWGDGIGGVEWQILLFCVSIFIFIKGNDF